MSEKNRYYDLDVWKESRKLTNQIYNLTKSFPEEEKFGLISQIRRCSVSIPSNIAEGCGRQTPKDTTRFLYIAKGSLYELETQVLLSFDQNYISDKDVSEVSKQIIVCKKLLNGFINYYKQLTTNN
ncbi:MAG: four helix bundle protein [Flavobacteriales bacterium]|nr:four helix bundle protein [Flavobacteriales bacterium]